MVLQEMEMDGERIIEGRRMIEKRSGRGVGNVGEVGEEVGEEE